MKNCLQVGETKEMPSSPPVSICLTTYNRAKVLPKTLDSLLSQTFPDYELIISDDCSTDDTEEVCRAYEARDARVKYYRNPTNLKMPGNLNAAISRAQGQYVANVHDGDLYHPDLILKWKVALDTVPTAAFVFNDYYCYHYKTGKKIILSQHFPLRVNGWEIASYYFKTFTSCVWGTVMARRKAYEQAGPFSSHYGFISDVDMWLRLARDNDVAYVAEPLITITPRESHHPYSFVHWHLILLNLAMYEHHLNFYGEVFEDKVRSFRREFPRRRRILLFKFMAICLKHQRWDRVREGLAIWREMDDPLLKRMGNLFGNQKYIPEWYKN
jgi:glycosyltransferase involved in cell wall biosynthesis